MPVHFIPIPLKITIFFQKPYSNIINMLYAFFYHAIYPHLLITSCLNIFSNVCCREPLAKDIISPLGDSVRHALKVKTFLYPEDVVSVRLMIACTYIPV